MALYNTINAVNTVNVMNERKGGEKEEKGRNGPRIDRRDAASVDDDGLEGHRISTRGLDNLFDLLKQIANLSDVCF